MFLISTKNIIKSIITIAFAKGIYKCLAYFRNEMKKTKRVSERRK